MTRTSRDVRFVPIAEVAGSLHCLWQFQQKLQVHRNDAGLILTGQTSALGQKAEEATAFALA
jgi:hypothetical protein